MIKIETAWEVISNAAKKAIATDMIYCSLKEHKEYCIL